MKEIRENFSRYMIHEAPQQLKDLFDRLDEDDGIMLQACFEDFAEMVLQQKSEKIDIDNLIRLLGERIDEKEDAIKSLELSANPNDWKKAYMEKLVVMGIIEAKQLLQQKAT